MSESSEHLPIENQSLPKESLETPLPKAKKEEKVARPLPASPVERAKLESQGQIKRGNELEERSTMVAFALLFVVPIFIILFAVLLLLPYINSQLSPESDPGGATVQTGPNMPPPTRE